jgi:hypothetical protein
MQPGPGERVFVCEHASLVPELAFFEFDPAVPGPLAVALV